MAEEQIPNQHSPPRVVILGGGYGGIYAALKLQKAARRGQIELALVSQDNYFLSQPMLAEVVSGSIEPPHIVSPIRRLLPYANFHQAEIEDVDAESRYIAINYLGDDIHLRSIPYDHLVIAVGTTTDLSRFPGMKEHAFPFKTLGDAFFLRSHLIRSLEEAEVEKDPLEKIELLTFVVAGGGYTGVEVAAEINDFVREAARSYRNIEPKEVNVVLLHSRDRILPVLTETLARSSHRVLERRGVEIRLNTRIHSATAQRAILGDGSEIPTRTLVAAVGSAPNAVLDGMPGERDSIGRLVVDETLSIPEDPAIWAVGDCAAVPDLRNGGLPCPPTAQYALRQAGRVARNILATIEGKPPKPFSYRSLGVFVPLGRFSGAAELTPIPWKTLRFKGFLAWWLYRTFYLYQLPRLERKLRVLTDWTLELIFRRDIVQMDITRSEGTSRAHYQAGEVIILEGNRARNFYTILRGQVEVVRDEDGQETPLATLGPGEYFGEMSLLRGVRHSATVRTLTPVDLLVMHGGDFKALAKSSKQFGEALDEVINQRLAENRAAGSIRSGPERRE